MSKKLTIEEALEDLRGGYLNEDYRNKCCNAIEKELKRLQKIEKSKPLPKTGSKILIIEDNKSYGANRTHYIVTDKIHKISIGHYSYSVTRNNIVEYYINIDDEKICFRDEKERDCAFKQILDASFEVINIGGK